MTFNRRYLNPVTLQLVGVGSLVDLEHWPIRCTEFVELPVLAEQSLLSVGRRGGSDGW